MSTARSDRVYEWWLQETTKFDYFVLGAALALVGYITSTLKPESIETGPALLQGGSLVAILASAIGGFKRIEASLSTLQANHRKLHALEGAGNLLRATEGPGPYLNNETGDFVTRDQAIQRAKELKTLAKQIDEVGAKWADRAKRRYTFRNRALLFGLGGLAAAWLWRATGF